MLQDDDMNDLQSLCHDHQEIFARGFCACLSHKFDCDQSCECSQGRSGCLGTTLAGIHAFSSSEASHGLFFPTFWSPSGHQRMLLPMNGGAAKGCGIHVPTAKICNPSCIALACVVVQRSICSATANRTEMP